MIENYYKKLFDSSLKSPSHLNEVLSHVPCSVIVEFNDILPQPYSKEEIHVALLQMHPCKASRPIGMHAIFFSAFGLL